MTYLPISAFNSFTKLTDAPSTFTGAGKSYVTVNPGETSLEFTPMPVFSVDLAQTAARAINTVYTNPSSTRPLMIIVSGYFDISVAAGSSYMTAYADSNATPTTIISGNIGILAPPVAVGLENINVQLTAIVGPGLNYRVVVTMFNGGTGGLAWHEMQL